MINFEIGTAGFRRIERRGCWIVSGSEELSSGSLSEEFDSDSFSDKLDSDSLSEDLESDSFSEEFDSAAASEVFDSDSAPESSESPSVPGSTPYFSRNHRSTSFVDFPCRRAINLRKVTKLKIHLRKNLNFDKTVSFFSHFPNTSLNNKLLG